MSTTCDYSGCTEPATTYLNSEPLCQRHHDEYVALDEPEVTEPLPESLSDAVAATVEALEALGTELQRAGGRDSSNSAIAYFCAYHQADVEGKDAGGWLGGPFLRDALRELSGEEA